MKFYNKLGALLLGTALLLSVIACTQAYSSENKDGKNKSEVIDKTTETDAISSKTKLVVVGDYPVPETINGYPVPKTVNGYPVIFVETSENCLWVPAGSVYLVLYDQRQNASPESIDHSGLIDSVSQLPKGWTIDIVGGQSLEDTLRVIEETIKKGNSNYEWYISVMGGSTGATLPDETQR